MAVYVIAVFLCRMDDGSGHDYASDDEHLSLSTVHRLFNAILGALSIFIQTILSSNASQGRRLRYERELH